MDTIITQLQEHINYVFLSIFLILLASLKDCLIKAFNKIKTNKELNIEKITQKNNLIYDLLSEIRIKADAARTYILEFHNGEYYSNGTPIIKFSMTYESCSLGVSTHAPSTQNFILSSYDGIKKIIEENNEIILTERLDECNFKGYLLEKNALALYCAPIRAHANKGNIIGVFCMEWCSPVKIKNINKEDIYNIKLKYLGIIQNLINKQK